MALLAPIFSVEADLQAAVLNLGSYDEEEIKADIDAVANSAPVVIYTYPLSPFSTEAVNVLKSTAPCVARCCRQRSTPKFPPLQMTPVSTTGPATCSTTTSPDMRQYISVPAVASVFV